MEITGCREISRNLVCECPIAYGETNRTSKGELDSPTLAICFLIAALLVGGST